LITLVAIQSAVATLLRRFHPFGEMLEARHLHSNEHLH